MGGGYPFWHSDLHLGPMSNQKGALVGIGGGYRVLAYVRGGGMTPLTSLLTLPSASWWGFQQLIIQTRTNCANKH